MCARCVCVSQTKRYSLDNIDSIVQKVGNARNEMKRRKEARKEENDGWKKEKKSVRHIQATGRTEQLKR